MMTRYILPGKFTSMKIGATSASNVDVAANTKFLRWRRTHRISPQTVANTKYPIGWFQPHSWIEGELGILSEAKDAFYDQTTAYIDDDGDNVIIPYFVAVVPTATAATSRTYTFSNLIISYVDCEVVDYAEPGTVQVYHFLSYFVTEA